MEYYMPQDPSLMEVAQTNDAKLSQRERNRENQRHTRARQKENIQRLEAVVRQYERGGVQVTTQVQLAARQVARENLLLRQLLSEQGLSNEYVKEYLLTGLSGPKLDVASAMTGPDVRARRSPVKSKPHVEERSFKHVEELQPFSMNVPSQRFAEDPAHLSQARHKPPMTDQDAIGTSMRTFAPASDETECTDAALIIASLRGGGAADDVRQELGCKVADRCYVKNHMVFSLAD